MSNGIILAAYLQFQDGRKRKFPIQRMVTTIGRGLSNDLSLDDPAVSSLHANIVQKEGRHTLFDMGSKNGLLINGQAAKEKALEPGDEIRVGNTVMVYCSQKMMEGGEEIDDLLTSIQTMDFNSSKKEILLTVSSLKEKEIGFQFLLSGIATMGKSKDVKELLENLQAQVLELPDITDAWTLSFAGERWERAAGREGGPELAPALLRELGRQEKSSFELEGARYTSYPIRIPGAPPLGTVLVAAWPKKFTSQLLLGLSFYAAQMWTNFQLQEAAAKRLLKSLADENAALKRRLEDNIEWVPLDEAARVVALQLEKMAPADLPVLITGETGAGKSYLARHVHNLSPRRGGPFVIIDCSTIPRELIESELFGHEKGSFTGADKLKFGKVEAAAGGTLFLDEVGELPPDMQAKLLRLVQDNAFERVGGVDLLSADCRVIAATNRDLEKDVGEGRFRKDLYYRLNVLTLRIPALRERPNEIEYLAKYFVKRTAPDREVEIEAATLARMRAFAWPGNIRQLENAVKRACVLCGGDLVEWEHLGLSRPEIPMDKEEDFTRCTLAEIRERAEKNAIADILRHHQGHLSRTAGQLGIARNTLSSLMEKYHLDKDGA